MKNLLIEKTETTPYVFVDCKLGVITITGICIPENPYAFFEPIIKKIDCISQTQAQIIFDIYLDYLNSGASKGLLNLLLAVKEDERISNSKVVWTVEDEEDEEARESGEVLEEISEIPFEYVTVNKL